MTDYRFRIKVESLSGSQYILEHFEVASEAESYFKELQKDGDDNPIYMVPDKTLVIAYDEFYKGTWVSVTRKMLTK